MTTIECVPADKKLQSLELETLKIFHNVCKKHNLKYFLIGGTLIGAVRHGGFIPWDDDIDVGMPRQDYNILLKNADKWFPQKLRLAHWRNTEQYVYNFSKLENRNTLLIEKPYQHLTKRKGGVYIDIFPFDGMPSYRITQLTWYCIVRAINRLTILMHCNTTLGVAKNYKDLGKACLGKICQSIFSDKKIHAFYDKLMQKFSFETSDFVINHSGMWGIRELFPKNLFGKLKTIDFENHEFYTVSDYDSFLSLVYGDYMKLPPLEKRVSHHDFYYKT